MATDRRSFRPRDNLITLISGRLQCEGNAEQGIPGFATELEERFQDTGLARVELRTWDSDMEGLAEWIFRRCSHVNNVRHLVIAYSWGGGFGLKRLAIASRRRGLRISGVVTSDAVAHFGPAFCHRFPFYLSQVIACWPPPYWPLNYLWRAKIRLPDNINKENFYWYLQENSWLRGHDIYWQGTGQRADNRVVIPDRDHCYMDECPEFRERSLLSAYQLFGVPAAA